MEQYSNIKVKSGIGNHNNCFGTGILDINGGLNKVLPRVKPDQPESTISRVTDLWDDISRGLIMHVLQTWKFHVQCILCVFQVCSE